MYEFEDALFTENDVIQRAQEKGMTMDEYLSQNPEIIKVDEGKENDTATTDTASVSDTVSTLENGSSEQFVAPIGSRNEWITNDFFNLQEEEAKGQLKQRYPDFEFSETGKFFPFDEATKNDPRSNQRLGLSNFIEVKAPNGEKLLLETALSSSNKNVVNKKGGKDFLNQYYKDQIKDLTNFIDINQTAKTEDLYTAKKKRRTIYEKFNESTKLTDQELKSIEEEFKDISVFDTKRSKDFVGYIPTRERVPGLPEYKDITTQP